jgi:hypothetical protein
MQRPHLPPASVHMGGDLFVQGRVRCLSLHTSSADSRDLAIQLLENEVNSLKVSMAAMFRRLEDNEEKTEKIYYAPGMPGFVEAECSFHETNSQHGDEQPEAFPINSDVKYAPQGSCASEVGDRRSPQVPP